jgi:CHAD domain-containing protein
MKWLVDLDPREPVGGCAWHSLSPRLRNVRKYLRRAAESWDKQDSGDGRELVHELRVATRRAHAALHIYDCLLPETHYSWWNKWLKRIRQAAATARDADVLAAHFSELPPGLLHDLILRRLADERAVAQEPIWEVAERLERKKRWRKHYKRLKTYLRADHESHTEIAQPFGSWAQRRIEPLVADFWQSVAPADAELARLHQFRIESKKLRYAIELLGSVFPPELRTVVLPRLEQLQQVLGDLNDCVQRSKVLSGWRNEFDDQQLEDQLQELEAAEQRRIDEQRKKFEQWWAAESQTLRAALNDGGPGDASCVA